jgi:ligand-binding sensor domain-containing protein
MKMKLKLVVLLSIIFMACSTHSNSVDTQSFDTDCFISTSPSSHADWTSYRNSSTNGNRFRNVTVGHDGTVWATTYGCGVFRFDGKTWSNYPYEGPVAIASDGMVWVGIKGGLARFDGYEWQVYTKVEAKHGITALAIAPDDTVWVVLWAVGIGHFDGEKWTLYVPENTLPGECEYVRDIAVSANGKVWAGFEKATQRSRGGVAQFDGKKWTLYTDQNGWTENTIASIAIAPDGGVWVSTRHGEISRFDGEIWQSYPAIHEAVGDISPRLAVGTDGSLWAGIFTAALRLDGQRWSVYRKEDGLVDDGILSIATGPNGDVWFATINGLFRYIPPNS